MRAITNLIINQTLLCTPFKITYRKKNAHLLYAVKRQILTPLINSIRNLYLNDDLTVEVFNSDDIK